MGKSALHVLAKRSTPNFVMRDKEREKRRKILKMCVQKLRDIDDPETVLCRAVLINNTFKTLKYAYRKVFRPEPEQVHHVEQEEEDSDNGEEEEEQEDNVSSDESSNSDDESVPASSSDNESDIDNDAPILEAKTDTTYCQDELDNFTDGCDLKNFNAESIVHSLMMPPLLSPQIEDMTNCSFYDSFNAGQSSDSSVVHSESSIKNNENTFSQDSNEDLTATFKFAVVNNVTSNQDVTQSNNLQVHGNYTTSSSELEFCQKSDFPTCVQSDIGNCNSMLIDNLLTEIVQA